MVISAKENTMQECWGTFLTLEAAVTEKVIFEKRLKKVRK